MNQIVECEGEFLVEVSPISGLGEFVGNRGQIQPRLEGLGFRRIGDESYRLGKRSVFGAKTRGIDHDGERSSILAENLEIVLSMIGRRDVFRLGFQDFAILFVEKFAEILS